MFRLGSQLLGQASFLSDTEGEEEEEEEEEVKEEEERLVMDFSEEDSPAM